MADILIIYPADKQTATTRLSEAIASAGYSVTSSALSDPNGLPAALEQASTAKAALLIWSRSMVTSALQQGSLAKVRKQKNLVEVSADGITPLGEGDSSRVALISGWRGQPFHPGWQRILSELERLCGAPPAPVEQLKQPAPKQPPPKQPPRVESSRTETAERAPSAPAPRPARPTRGFAKAAIAVVLLLGVTIGAVSWISRSTYQANSVSQPQPETAAPRPARAKGPTAVPALPPTVAQPSEASPPQTASAAPALPAPEPKLKSDVAAAPSSPKAKPAAKRSAQEGSEPDRKARETPKAKPRPPVKQYSPRNSETMRLFCEGSGRSTAQCRTFLRSTRTSS